MRNASSEIVRIAEPSINTQEGVVSVEYTMFALESEQTCWQTFGERHVMRYFFPQEILLFAGLSGFGVESSEEFGTGNCPSESTWGISYILKKL